MRLLLWLPVVATFLMGADSTAADWPRWRGPAGNGHLPQGESLPTRLPDSPRTLWEKEIGSGVGSPVVSAGRVFYLDADDGQELLRAVAADTGKELWSQPIDRTFRDSQSEPGPRSTPTVDGDRVYAVSCRGEFHCRATDDGRLLWKVNFVRDFQAVFIGESGSAAGASRHGNTASPLIDGDRLLVSVGGTNGASIVCFDKRSGAVQWKSQNDVPGYSGPVLATLHGKRQLISFTAAGVFGLDADNGDLRWRVPVESSIGRHVISPIVVGDRVVVSSHQAGLLGFQVTRTDDHWQANQAWVRKDLAINFASPVAVGNHLYGLGPARNLICVDLTTGELAWSKDGYFSTAPGNAYGGFLATAERLLFLTDSGELVLMTVGPKAPVELGRTQVAGKNWCNPAWSGGRLYLRDNQVLRCVEIAP